MPVVSAIVGASGAGTGVRESSAVLAGDRCFPGVGDQLACLSLPELLLLWHLQGDGATCFGVYRGPEGRGLIVHGELEVSAVTLEGELLWGFAGRDIFTGPFRVSGNWVFATDWDGRLYCLDAATGATVPAHREGRRPFPSWAVSRSITGIRTT
jgi:outer membrane protein assembly factor BamB